MDIVETLDYAEDLVLVSLEFVAFLQLPGYRLVIRLDNPVEEVPVPYQQEDKQDHNQIDHPQQ